MIRKFLPVLLPFLVWGLSAKASFNFDTNCIDAYKAILDLRMNDAKVLIQREKKQSPGNGIIILLENYADFFGLLASENKTDYERLKDNKPARIDALAANDRNSPFYLYSQAEIYLQWSFLKAKFGDYLSSALDSKKASSLLQDNDEKFPGFFPGQKCKALIAVIFGSIPASLKGVSHFMGMSGNVQLGLKKLEELKKELPKTKFTFFNNELIFLICTIDISVLHNANSYVKLTSYLSEMENSSLLKAWLQGYVASKTGHNDEAIGFLEAAPKAGGYIKLPAIDYLLGCARLNRMDNDRPVALYDFIKEFRGENYIKDAYLKLAFCYLLQNDWYKYEYFINQVKTRGYQTNEKDRQALFEANDAKPDADLLKARFYFDGGYYGKALAQLNNKTDRSFKLLRDKTELYYRLGRTFDKTGKFNEAVLNYQRAINLGKTTDYYYAANSALNTGRIFEERKDFKKAADYYNQALGMHGHQYQTDIDNDAKAGLKRINQ